MVTRQTFATVAVIATLLLAGCSTFTIFEEKTTGEKIEDEMKSVETVQVNSSTTEVISIRNNKTVINHTVRQQTISKYNFTDNALVVQGVGTEQRFNQNQQFAFETYYKNGTQYQKRTSASSQNESQWSQEDIDRDLRKDAALVANASFLDQYNSTVNNSTRTYEINMLKNPPENNSLFKNNSLAEYEYDNELLDIYVLEIEIDNRTNRVKQVNIFIQASLTSEELAQINSQYDENSRQQGRLTYVNTRRYDYYNEPTNVTVPENATN